jgi:FMN phosphatase YigB (HAD superfamily)
MADRLPEPVPIKGVIFDFHATLVDARDPASWVRAALARLGRSADAPTGTSTGPDMSTGTRMDAEQIDGLAEHLDRIWEHAATFDPDSQRDLSHERHRDVFSRAVALRPGVDPDLIDALYTLMPEQWIAFDDTAVVLRELNARGVRVVVLSNIGLDIRDCLERAGVSDVITGYVLSYEVGMVKPAPEIFARALEVLDLPASQALMVGDSWRHDAGAAELGIRTLILPRTVGPIHGLAAVLQLTMCAGF